MADVQEQQWYYLETTGATLAPQGPFSAHILKGLFAQKIVSEDSLVWAEGQEDWLPLRAVHGLYAAVLFQDDVEKQVPAKRSEAAEVQAQLDALQEAADGPASPTPSEREFTDDDGVHYVWDSSLRKFCPQETVDSVGEDASRSTAQCEGDSANRLHPMLQEQTCGPASSTAHPADQQYTTEAMTFVADEVPDVRHELQELIAEREKAKQAAAACEVDEGETDAKQGEETAIGTPVEEAPKSTDKRDGQERREKRGPTNTSVYVSGLPLDTTVEEVAGEFKRCGIIRSTDDRQPRIKLYKDGSSGELKGDALISFLQRPSVSLAIKLMDGHPLRPGSTHLMHVQEAEFSGSKPPGSQGQKRTAGDDNQRKSKQSRGGPGKKKPPQVTERDRLLGWGGYDDAHKAAEVTALCAGLYCQQDVLLHPQLESEISTFLIERCKTLGAMERVRVLKDTPVVTLRFRLPDPAKRAIIRLNALVHITNMFTPAALRSDPTLDEDVRSDIVMKAEEVGVRVAMADDIAGGPIRVLHGSESGSVLVAFQSVDAARRLADVISGLSYDGRILQAALPQACMWDGKTPYATYGSGGDLQHGIAVGTSSDASAVDQTS